MDFVNDKRILIGNDHGGYESKVKIAEHLREKGYEVIDVGSENTEIVRYPNYVKKVAGPISKGGTNQRDTYLLHRYRHVHCRQQIQRHSRCPGKQPLCG